jgi:glutathione S-transferase
MDWQAIAFWPVLRPLFVALIRTAPAERDASVVSKAEALALSAVRILDHRLEDRVFLAGDAFTMGDIPAATSVHRWYSLDIDHPELPNVRRWYDLMRARFAFQQIVMTPLS